MQTTLKYQMEQPIRQTRSRKPEPVEKDKYEAQSRFTSDCNQLSQTEIAMSNNAQQRYYLAAHYKEYQDDVRRIIKIKRREKGITETYAHIFAGCLPGTNQYAQLQEMEEILEQEEWGKLSAQNTIALFVTLSPEPGTVTPIELLASFEKMLGKDKQGIAQSYWSIENEGTNGPHPHIHSLIYLDKTKPSGERGKVRAMIKRHLEKYKTKTEHYLQIKPVSEAKVKDKLDYVMGNKREKVKMEFVEKDRQWRKDNNYQELYAHPPI